MRISDDGQMRKDSDCSLGTIKHDIADGDKERVATRMTGVANVAIMNDKECNMYGICMEGNYA